MRAGRFCLEPCEHKCHCLNRSKDYLPRSSGPSVLCRKSKSLHCSADSLRVPAGVQVDSAQDGFDCCRHGFVGNIAAVTRVQKNVLCKTDVARNKRQVGVTSQCRDKIVSFSCNQARESDNGSFCCRHPLTYLTYLWRSRFRTTHPG